MKTKIFCTIILLLCSFKQLLHAQLSVTDTLTDAQMVETLVGTGVTITNIHFDCPNGAYGTFNFSGDNCNNPTFQMNKGVVLTSGGINQIPGPNNSGGAGVSNSGLGDSDLDQIVSPQQTFDACALIMDIKVEADTLEFNYIFASEEYQEYVNSSFNDIFSFFIEGPSVPFQNIALVPGTNVPVSINNVNQGEYNQYFSDNGDGNSPPFDADSCYLQYDGLTTKLTAKHWVIPCETYTLKLVVADAGDGILDSGVFIEAGSIHTNIVNVEASTDLASDGFLNAVEGCVNGILKFKTSKPVTDTVTIYFTLAGTATYGEDYFGIPDSILFYPGDTVKQISLMPILDNEPEPNEYVTVYIQNGGACGLLASDSAVINIQDNILPIVTPEVTQTCPGTPFLYQASGGISYHWEPNTYLSCSDCPNPICTPLTSISYTITVSVGPCQAIKQVNVNVTENPNAGAVSPVSVCGGNNAQLQATGGFFYQWEPANNLSCVNCPNPIYNGTQSDTLMVTIIDDFNCPHLDTVIIQIGNLTLPADTLNICQQSTYQINYPADIDFTWTPTQGLSCNNCPNPTITANQNINYTLIGSKGTCADTTTVSVIVHSAQANAGPDAAECDQITTQIGTPAQIAYTYAWSPAQNLNQTTIPQPTVQLSTINNTPNSQTYTLTVTDTYGCTATDQTIITADAKPILSIIPPPAIQGNSVPLELNGVPNGATVTWLPTTGLNNPNIPKPLANPVKNTTYTATVTTLAGCIDSISVDVFALPPRF